MKTTVLRLPLLLVASLLSLGVARAQQAVPNGTLETWVTRNGAEAPAQWLTFEDAVRTALPGFPFPSSGSVTKSTDRRTGSFAAKLTTVQNAVISSEEPGLLVLGSRFTPDDVNGDSVDLTGGLPYTARAARMQFYYKFAGTVASPDDRPTASVSLTKTIAGVRQVVATGRVYLQTLTPAYTLGDIVLKYKQSYAPDSLHIVFSSFDINNGSDFTIGNTLFVDDVTLSGVVAATRDPQLQAAVRVFPNPSASGRFTLGAAQEPALLTAPLTVTDALGRVVLRQAAALAAGPRVVDLSQRPAGVYSLRLDTERGPVVHQLLIQ